MLSTKYSLTNHCIIDMYKLDLALNKPHGLICQKQPTNQPNFLCDAILVNKFNFHSILSKLTEYRRYLFFFFLLISMNYIYIYIATLIYIYIYIYIATWMTIEIYTSLSPYDWALWRRSSRVAISVYCQPLPIWIEVSVAIERMYINNSNCDS